MTFQLWLDPIHGPAAGLTPLDDELLVSTEPSEHLLRLRELAAEHAQRIGGASTPPLAELQMDDDTIYCRTLLYNGNAFMMPLTLSQVAGCAVAMTPESASGGTVGIIAYTFPSNIPEWFATTFFSNFRRDAASSVWIIHVTSAVSNQNVVSEQSSIMDAAMAAMVDRAAVCICSQRYRTRLTDDTLGEGGHSTVRLCQRRGDGTGAMPLAAKFGKRSAAEEGVLRELSFLLAAQGHPNICRHVGVTCAGTTVDNLTWTIVMEAHLGGCLHSVVHRNRAGLEQVRALRVTEDVLEALSHIHSVGIVHRDVKPENVLIAGDGRAVLIDFGVSVHVAEREEMVKKCGTLGSIAPEMLLSQRYGCKVDVFGCGTVLYYALGGLMPFRGCDENTTLHKNVKARVKFPRANFAHVASRPRKLAQLLMWAQPEMRPSARVGLAHVRNTIAKLEHEVAAQEVPAEENGPADPLPGSVAGDEVAAVLDAPDAERLAAATIADALAKAAEFSETQVAVGVPYRSTTDVPFDSTESTRATSSPKRLLNAFHALVRCKISKTKGKKNDDTLFTSVAPPDPTNRSSFALPGVLKKPSSGRVCRPSCRVSLRGRYPCLSAVISMP